MILECDNCEKTFEVDDAQAGGKTPCPHCGDINRVPAASAAPKIAGSAVDPVRPSAGLGSVQERELRIIRPAMLRAHPIRYSLMVLGFLGGSALSIAAPTSESVPRWLMWPGLLLIAVTLVYFMYWWIRTHWWMKLVITNKRSIRTIGIIKRHMTEVLHDHVRSVDINQTVVQRVFKVGQIGIDSAGQEGIEIVIDDLPDPYEIKRLIDQHRRL